MRIRRAVLVTCVSAAVLGLAAPGAPQTPPFTFHSNAWLNLHHFARSVARGAPGPAGLSGDEQRRWDAGVVFYRPYAARDVLRDEGMVAIARALRDAEGRTTLDGIAIDADLKVTLESMMPVYRATAWNGHDRANRAWIDVVTPLVVRHGAAIRDGLTRVYGIAWPAEPMHVDLSVAAGPVGAFSVNQHITISSSDPGYRSYAGLEMVFHEGSHGLDLFQAVIAPLTRIAESHQVTLPPQLWHAILFYTAGELTKRELKAAGVDYTTYADAALYEALCGPQCAGRIAAHWGPRIDGTRSIDDALAALVTAFK